MLINFGIIIIFFITSILLLTGLFYLQKHLDLKRKIPVNNGYKTDKISNLKLDIRFYFIALLFVIFSTSIVILFPIALILKKFGFSDFLGMFVFISIITIGFGYLWSIGDLNWRKTILSCHKNLTQKIDNDLT